MLAMWNDVATTGLCTVSACDIGKTSTGCFCAANVLGVSIPAGRGVIFEDTTALQSGSLGSGGGGAADFPRAISTVPDPDQAPNVGAGPVDYPGSIGGGGSGISTVPDPDDAPPAPSNRPSVSFWDCGGPGGCGTDSDAGSVHSQGDGGSGGNGRGGGGAGGNQNRESQSQEAERSHAALDSVLNPQTAAWERHPEVMETDSFAT